MRFGVTVERVILSDTMVRLIISRLVSVSGSSLVLGSLLGLLLRLRYDDYSSQPKQSPDSH